MTFHLALAETETGPTHVEWMNTLSFFHVLGENWSRYIFPLFGYSMSFSLFQNTHTTTLDPGDLPTLEFTWKLSG